MWFNCIFYTAANFFLPSKKCLQFFRQSKKLLHFLLGIFLTPIHNFECGKTRIAINNMPVKRKKNNYIDTKPGAADMGRPGRSWTTQYLRILPYEKWWILLKNLCNTDLPRVEMVPLPLLMLLYILLSYH